MSFVFCESSNPKYGKGFFEKNNADDMELTEKVPKSFDIICVLRGLICVNPV